MRTLISSYAPIRSVVEVDFPHPHLPLWRHGAFTPLI